MGAEEIIFCKGLKSCHLGLRFAASKGGCSFGREKSENLDEEEKKN